MKSKFLCMILALTLFLQMGLVAPAFAQTATSVNIDFSDADAVYDVSNTIDGTHDYSIVYGGYGKASDDASIRLYSVGGTGTSNDLGATKTLSISNDNVSAASDGKYSHLSFQFLNEDGYSTVAVSLDYYNKSDVKMYSKLVMTQPRTAGIWKQNRLFPQSSSGVKNINATIATWSQVDIYFNPTDITQSVLFVNGAKYDVDVTGWSKTTDTANDSVKKITKVNLQQIIKGTSPYNATAVRFDNVIFEAVNAVPATQNYRYPGEVLDFDDYMSIGADGSYMTKYYHSTENTTSRFDVATSTKPGVQFKSSTANTIESGVLGRYSWDNSLHTSIPSDASENSSAMYYNPGVKDFKAGDYAHLTFAIANATDDQSAGLSGAGAKIGSGTLDSFSLFEMSADSGVFKFFGNDVSVEWESDKWYKVDMLFKVGNGTSSYTTADCYIDGVKYLSDYEFKLVDSDYSLISDFGMFGFTDTPGADYYVDDVGFGLFSSSSYCVPSDGWTLSSTDSELDDAIDNAKKTITVSGAYKAEDFLAKISDSQFVTLYNANGHRVESGLLTSCIIKVSNNFGAGTYYTVESAGSVEETNLFNLLDGATAVANVTDTLKVNVTGCLDAIDHTDIYIDGKLYTSTELNETSIDLTQLMFGKHIFEAYAWINDKDCYMDEVSLNIVEEKETNYVNNDISAYTAGSSSMSGGRVVQQGSQTLVETITDKNGKDYGASMVMQSTKALYEAAGNTHNLYMDIYMPEANMITKSVVEFDICYLSDNISISANYRGKDNLNSSNTSAVSYGPFTLGTTTVFNGQEYLMETNRWYHLKSMVDVKNKVASFWVDGIALGENVPISTNMVQIASELRMQMRLPDEKYDNTSTYRFAALDNIKFTEYDELAYIKSVEDADGNSPADYTSDVLTIKMSTAVEEITKDNVLLSSTNGLREVASVTIDELDASIIYVTPKYKLSSSDTYSVIIKSGLRSQGSLSTRDNCGFFETTSKSVDVLNGSFDLNDGKISFITKLTNKTISDKELTVIAYVYEGTEFKGIASKTVTVKAGKNLTESVELPYYSATAKIYALVVDDWSTMKPVSNKLYSYSY